MELVCNRFTEYRYHGSSGITTVSQCVIIEEWPCPYHLKVNRSFISTRSSPKMLEHTSAKLPMLPAKLQPRPTFKLKVISRQFLLGLVLINLTLFRLRVHPWFRECIHNSWAVWNMGRCNWSQRFGRRSPQWQAFSALQDGQEVEKISASRIQRWRYRQRFWNSTSFRYSASEEDGSGWWTVSQVFKIFQNFQLIF